MLLSAVGSVRGETFYTVDAYGNVLRNTPRRIVTPVTETRLVTQQQTFYRQRVVTDQQEVNQVQWVPQPAGYGQQVSYRPQSVAIKVPVTRSELVPETRTVQVPITQTRFVSQEIVTSVPQRRPLFPRLWPANWFRSAAPANTAVSTYQAMPTYQPAANFPTASAWNRTTAWSRTGANRPRWWPGSGWHLAWVRGQASDPAVARAGSPPIIAASSGGYVSYAAAARYGAPMSVVGSPLTASTTTALVGSNRTSFPSVYYAQPSAGAAGNAAQISQASSRSAASNDWRGTR